MSTQFYDFTLVANGSQIILAEGAYFKVLTSSGVLDVRLSDGSKYGPIGPGQGARNKDFKRLTLVDKSGSANSGVLIVSDADFVDDQLALTSAALSSLARPEQASATVSSVINNAALVPETFLLPAVNTGGVVILGLEFSEQNTNGILSGFLAKTSAPATLADGEGLLMGGARTLAGALYLTTERISGPIKIAPGKGIYFLSVAGIAGGAIVKHLRYVLL
jgi:hypothetical protein